MRRYLTTQERVNLAVKAGHAEKVAEYCRMHNNGDGIELESLYVLDADGGKITYDRLPPYGIAAVDSYLNMFDTPLVTDEELQLRQGPRVLTIRERVHYARNAAHHAVKYRAATHRPKELIERVASGLEFEAIDTYFILLVDVANMKLETPTGITLVSDEDGSQTLTLSNGAVVEMTPDVEHDDNLGRVYVLVKEGTPTKERGISTPLANKLIDELTLEAYRHRYL